VPTVRIVSPVLAHNSSIGRFIVLRKLKVPALALVFTLSGPLAFADSSSDDFDKLIDLSGVSNSIEAMSQMVSTEMGQEHLEAQIGDPQIARIVSRSLQSSLTASLFERSIIGELRDRLSQQEISGLLAWYETPVGQRVAAAHLSDQWAIDQRVTRGERPEMTDKRRALIEKLDQVVMGSDNAMDLAIDTAAIMGHSMMSSMGMPMALEEVRQMVSMDMQGERANMIDEYHATLGFMYESLSDADLEQMIAYSIQPEATVFCDAMWSGLRAAFHEGGAALGVALVSELQESF
jgi:hypothetical protein